MQKTCTVCGETKPLEAMSRGGKRHSVCKACRNAAIRAATKARQEAAMEGATCSLVRVCQDCGMERSVFDFPLLTNKRGNPIRISYCRECRNAQARERQRKTRERRRAERAALPPPVSKVCVDCGEEKPLSDFPTHSARCKPCFSVRNRAWFRERYKRNREQILADQRRYRAENADRINAVTRERYQRNADAYRERARRYNERNKERSVARAREWKRNNPEKHRDSIIRRRARELNAPRVEIIDRKAIIERDRSTCYLCGQVLATHEVTLDHVIPLTRGGAHAADNLRVACNICNARKNTLTYDEYVARYGITRQDA